MSFMSFSWAFLQAHDVNAVLDCLRLVPRWLNFFWSEHLWFHHDFRYVTLGKGLWIPCNICTLIQKPCINLIVISNIGAKFPINS